MVKSKKIEVTQQELKEILHYDENTGVFTWKIYRASNAKVGDVAGCLNKVTGYYKICYNRQVYMAHRLAWLYVHGEIPNGLNIDHKDLNKTNNKINNLRLCTCSENQQNVNVRKDNTSGYKGVTYNKKANKWVAYAKLNNKRVYLGLFSDKEEAVTKRDIFELEHHGEFYN